MCERCDTRKENWITVNPKTVTYYTDDLGATLFVVRCIYKNWDLDQYHAWITGQGCEEWPFLVEVHRQFECPDCGKTYTEKLAAAYFDTESLCLQFMHGFGYGTGIEQIDGARVWRDFFGYDLGEEAKPGDVEDYCIPDGTPGLPKYRYWACVVAEHSLDPEWQKFINLQPFDYAYIMHSKTRHYHFLLSFPYPVDELAVFSEYSFLAKNFVGIACINSWLDYVTEDDRVSDLHIVGEFKAARDWKAGANHGA